METKESDEIAKYNEDRKQQKPKIAPEKQKNIRITNSYSTYPFSSAQSR